MALFGRTRSGRFYNKDKHVDNSDHPVTFADAYVDESDDLKDKHNFADERIAEQEEKDRLEQIKKEQDDAQSKSDNESVRKMWLDEIDDILVKTMDVDEKIRILSEYANDSDGALNDSDVRELHQEINELKEMKKSIEKENTATQRNDDANEKSHNQGTKSQEKIEDKIDELKRRSQSRKDGAREVKDGRSEQRRGDRGNRNESPGSTKDHSNLNLPGPDESIRMSYLLASAGNEE